MFTPDDKAPQVSLKEFFEATRAPEDMGYYRDYQKIVNKMGLVADKKHYLEVRAKARNSSTAKQYKSISRKLEQVLDTIRADVVAGRRPSNPLPDEI